ncbi:MAG: ROK family protein [Rubellimicrobium sp.]|nr:ROK family protein [Rubellimicrobium sp.]
MSAPALAIDLGGTKILAALVAGGCVIERATAATDRDGGPQRWLQQMGELVRNWSGRWQRAGITVTGLVQDGRWSALNRATLDLPRDFPLAERAAALLGRPVTLANDAQAAAWGEFRHGAGQGCTDMVFLTVSTGIGGGVVAGGRLLRGRAGLAGHVGLLAPLPDGDGPILEDSASGRFIARRAGQPDARAAFAALPEARAEAAVAASARRVARLCRNLHLILAPDRIVIGGGVGLAPGYLPRVTAELAVVDPRLRPTLTAAALGPDAGVVGIAALTFEPPD